MDFILGMIAYFGFNFVPMDWLGCNGQLLSVGQNQALYSLLGIMYGGDGSTNFGLPDLRGRVVLGAGTSTASNTNYIQKNPTGNTETVTLTAAQMPSHTHTATIGAASTTIKAYSGTGNTSAPGRSNVLAGASSNVTLYSSTDPDTALNVGGGAVTGTVIVSPTGNSIPVSIMQPYCVLNACICTVGIYPQRQ